MGIYHSRDNGLNWQKVTAPDNAQHLEFRDIQLLDDGAVIIMSAGEGESSRIYRSDNAGQDWRLLIQGSTTETFYDCLHFTDSQHGWLYGDADKQGLFVLKTEDGGLHWQRQTLAFSAQSGEGGFASSGTCLNQGDNHDIYIGTGNSDKPRLLHFNQAGWRSIASPMVGGEAAGIFSVQQSAESLYIFGGSLKNDTSPAQAFRFNLNSNTWLPLPDVPLKGAIYGSAIVKLNGNNQVLIANPQGVAKWQQDQQSWIMLSQSNIWSLACDPAYGCVGVGKNGVVESFNLN